VTSSNKSSCDNKALQRMVDVNMWSRHRVNLCTSNYSTISRELRADTHEISVDLPCALPSFLNAPKTM
jgi:hypothetical protein